MTCDRDRRQILKQNLCKFNRDRLPQNRQKLAFGLEREAIEF